MQSLSHPSMQIEATVVPRRHPDYPEFDVPGAVTVVIVPEDLSPKPQPTQDLLDRTALALPSAPGAATPRSSGRTRR